jgi:hypothetical protein
MVFLMTEHARLPADAGMKGMRHLSRFGHNPKGELSGREIFFIFSAVTL